MAEGTKLGHFNDGVTVICYDGIRTYSGFPTHCPSWIMTSTKASFVLQEKLEKYNIQVTTSVRKPTPPKQSPGKGSQKRFDDDDDIEIVSEKITPKTKMKIAQKKKLAKMKPKAVIKVNSAQGKQMLKTIAKTGKVPKSLSTSSASSSTSIFSSSSGFGDDDEEEEEDNLNCPTCFSAFWYPSQVSKQKVLDPPYICFFLRRLST